MFPISRDPPEGGTPVDVLKRAGLLNRCFQFLGIPPKGERSLAFTPKLRGIHVSNF